MAITSRGFSGRRTPADVKLPPGQYLTTDFPVLSAGPTPHVALDKWEFTIDDGTDVLRRWNWKSFRELPAETITVDIHCVTRWSKLGTTWEGVSLDTLFKMTGRRRDEKIVAESDKCCVYRSSSAKVRETRYNDGLRRLLARPSKSPDTEY